jgi:hypothetical protein
MSLAGLRGWNGVRFSTRVEVGNDQYAIAGDQDTKNPKHGIFLPIGPDEWRYIETKSEESLRELDSALTRISDQIRDNPHFRTESSTMGRPSTGGA